jgi:hypothetical protein
MKPVGPRSSEQETPRIVRLPPRLRVSAILAVVACASTASTQSCSTGEPAVPGGPPGSAVDAGGGARKEGGVATEGGAAVDGADLPSTCAQPFAVDTPATYVAKLKNLLVGLPPTDAEVNQVQGGGASALGALIDSWMTSTAPLAGGSSYAALYQAKMIRFFALAFQQTQIDNSSLGGALDIPIQYTNAANAALITQNIEEIIPRTMLALAQQGVPFNQALSTRSFMMTTAAKALMGFTDDYVINDSTGAQDFVQAAYPTAQLTIATSGTTDASTWTFVDPSVQLQAQSPQLNPGTPCNVLVFPASPPKSVPYYVAPFAQNLFDMLMGGERQDGTGNCQAAPYSQGVFQPSDFTDWQMVTFSQPLPNTTIPPFPFWDLANLRSGGTNSTNIVLNRATVGFFTMPAFYANWATNFSNQMRVTANQALIVATNSSYDGTDRTIPNVDAGAYGLDLDHAQPNSPCYNCHLRMDPTREIFATSYSWYYGWNAGHGNSYVAQPAYFVFQGQQGPMSSLADFGTMISNHPLVAPGWAQKLCYYINSAPCLADDPAFTSIVTAFQQSYSWNDLLKAVLTSPITTHVAPTASVIGTASEVGNCAPVAVARRDHWCAALNARLGFQDICGQSGAIAAVFSHPNEHAQSSIPSGMPADGYGRGNTVPLLPNQPSLFFRTGVENFCTYIAQIVIDNPKPPAGATTWSSQGCTAQSCAPIGSNCAQDSDGGSCAIVGDFVTLVAGLAPSDPRAGPLASALLAHFAEALQAVDGGAAATTALQSAFVAACVAPSAVSIGL